MSAGRRTLGAQLVGHAVLATALGLVAFAAVAAAVVWVDEVTEAEHGDDDDDEGDEPVDEVLDDLGLAVLLAAPVGLGAALVTARWSARRVGRRLDALIAAASRMTADQLHARLPAGDDPARRDELDQLAAALNGLFARLEAGIAGLRGLAADTSHELRTPLAVMINTLEVAARRPRDAEAWARTGATVLDELRHLAELVEALLHGARAGGFDLAAAPVALGAALAAARPRWTAEAAPGEVAIVLDAGAGAAARIDPRALAIAAGNLVRNAIAHSPRGATVTVRVRADADRVRLEVEDQGPGIAPAERERVFAPYARGAAPARPDGVGLGLAITRRIAEAAGGRVFAAEAPGGGARLVLELPRADAQRRTSVEWNSLSAELGTKPWNSSPEGSG